jgi:hypothetical protein
MAICVHASAQKIVTFDAPNNGTGWQQGTYPVDINILGVVTGSVTDSGYGTHGFVRDAKGNVTNFDVPEANPVVGCTCPAAINDFGVVTGVYRDSNDLNHGFIREPNGKIITFDDPEAGTANWQGTTPMAINNIGAVVGYYNDANWGTHGFLRSADGKITTIDDTAGGVGTTPASINDFGTIAGTVVDANNVSHGFFRTFNGKFTTFDVPAAVGSSIGTYSAAINDFGVISGFYNDASSLVYVGYIRSVDGKFTTFSPPQAGPWEYSGTFNVTRATLFGSATTGCIDDPNYIFYPFLAEANGSATTFAIPGQMENVGWNYGACGDGINEEREIVGYWRDPNGAFHGFLRLPEPDGDGRR